MKLYQGDKIGFVGRNGTGKSTLLKIINVQDKEFQGRININTRVDYLPQFYNYQSGQTVEDFFTEVTYVIKEELIRTFLGSMLFRGEDVYKKIKNLSIDERVRVAFTILLMSNANFLLLDEPLNHLDIVSRERMEAALKEYFGSFLVVTHDRYFASETVNEIWELTDKGLECFHGNYDGFLKYKQGKFKDGQDLKNELVKMKRVELLARLGEAIDEEEIKRIQNRLDQL